MKIHLVMLGKTRRPELRALQEDYLARIRHFAPVEVSELRQAAALDRLKAEPTAVWAMLDGAGHEFESREFAGWLSDLRERGVRELIFLCGDAEGYPDAWRARARERISLGKMTISHELARVVLAEQLYRVFALLAGHPYPK